MNAFFNVFLCGVYFELVFAITPESRQFNLALETILQFDDNDNATNFKLIENAQNFLGRLKKTLERKKPSRRSMGHTKVLTLSEFVKKTIVILNSYADEDLKDIFIVLDDELRKFHYKGCKFFELLDGVELRKIISNNLEKIKNSSAKNQKMLLKAVLIIIQKNERKKNGFINFINSLYNKESTDKLMIFLNDLKIYRDESKKSIAQLKKFVRDGIRNVVFDHYSNLDVDTRRRLKIVIHTFFKTCLKKKLQRTNTTIELNRQTSTTFETTLQEEKRRFGRENTKKNITYERHIKSLTTLQQEIFYRRKLTSNELITINFSKEHTADNRSRLRNFRRNNDEEMFMKDISKSKINNMRDHEFKSKIGVSNNKNTTTNCLYKNDIEKNEKDVRKITLINGLPKHAIKVESTELDNVRTNNELLKKRICAFCVSKPTKGNADTTAATISSTIDEYFFQIFNDEYTTKLDETFEGSKNKTRQGFLPYLNHSAQLHIRTQVPRATSVDNHFMTTESNGLFFQEEDSKETDLVQKDLEYTNTATKIMKNTPVSRSRVDTTDKSNSKSTTQPNNTAGPDVKSVIGSIVDDIHNIVNMKRIIASKSQKDVVLRTVEWTTSAPGGTRIVTDAFKQM